MDVVQLKLGMSPEQIEAGIKAFNSNMQMREIREKSASGADAVRVIDAWIGSTESGQSAQEIIVVFTRNEPIRAYEISKGSMITPDEQITFAQHLDMMRKRFGEPSNPFNLADRIGLPNTRTYVWAYDRERRKIDAVSLPMARLFVLCGGHGYDIDPPPYKTAHQITGRYATNLSDLVQVPYSFYPNCGATYRRQFVVDPGSGRVLQLFQDLVSDEMAVGDVHAAASTPEPDSRQQTQAAPADPPETPMKQLSPQLNETSGSFALTPVPAPAVSEPPDMGFQEQRAATVDAQAAFDLGLRYDQGRQVPQDFGKALSWYRRAAELGHAGGAFNAGVMYDSGKGVTADHAEAARWYDLAAQRGSPRAQYNLALLYEHGDGVPRDIPRAIALYRAAAANGITAAKARLALLTAHPSQ
jgi:hypothetical protein